LLLLARSKERKEERKKERTKEGRQREALVF